MTKQKLTIAELQLDIVALGKNHEAKVLGGDFWDCVCALWRASNPPHGKNIKSASVEM